jgi:hypothetical protein
MDTPTYPRLPEFCVWVVEEEQRMTDPGYVSSYPEHNRPPEYVATGKMTLSIVKKQTEIQYFDRLNPPKETAYQSGHIGTDKDMVTTDRGFMGKPMAWHVLTHITEVLLTEGGINPTAQALEQRATSMASTLAMNIRRKALVGEFTGRVQDAVE